MGKIVGGYATSHIAFSVGSKKKVRKILDGMAEIGRRMTADRPDLVVMIVGDHMFNFNLEREAPFILGTADQYETWGDMGIPPYGIKGHAEFAGNFLDRSARNGFDLATADTFRPDHGVALPMLFVKPRGQVPLVLLYVSIGMAPTPTPKRCYQLAQILKETIEQDRPADERVVVVGSGGLSHWPGMAGMGRVNAKFDQQCIDMLIAGQGHEMADWSAEMIFENSGNGGLEVINWLMMAGTLPGHTGEQIYHVPMHAWATGMAGIAIQGAQG
ncbi:MAG: hypothetical protein O7C63_10160 [Alphaproteobacteria bacterium]|nr:hypothetical protein [Alphaproteobacteria bacterium]